MAEDNGGELFENGPHLIGHMAVCCPACKAVTDYEVVGLRRSDIRHEIRARKRHTKGSTQTDIFEGG